jgi:hypothetical protein
MKIKWSGIYVHRSTWLLGEGSAMSGLYLHNTDAYNKHVYNAS